MAPARREAYCTLLTNDAYLPGAMVLARSLRDNGTKKQLVAFVTLDGVTADAITELQTIYNQIIPVDRIVNNSPANLYLMDRPDLHSAFTKIALWKQTQFDHLVYLDADIVSLRAPDELFNLSSSFAAVPDIGWPDCFNSGVLSFKPNLGDYYALYALAQRGISFDGADQGLLNMHFRSWERLSFAYNCTPSGNYQYEPAYRHFQSSISLVHYIGKEKPWFTGRGKSNGNGVYNELVGRWWAVYDKHYRTASAPNGSGGSTKGSRIVQQYTTGEQDLEKQEYPSEEAETEPVSDSVAPEHDEATSVGQHRDYSADWDPTRGAPQPGSRPEAPDFPLQQYQMSQDRHLFQAPPTPEPPKDLHYDKPKPSLKPIFPWESRARKPTRVFAEDLPPPPASVAQPIPSSSETEESLTEHLSTGATSATAEPTSPAQAGPTVPFSSFTTTNAWDNLPSINRYVSSLPQNRRTKAQSSVEEAGTPDPTSATATTGNPSKLERRSSKITDFPTEVERPSLPVTPAAVHRRSFWGAERDEAGELPPAEGVPEQSDWDPVARLVELQRKQSIVMGQEAAADARAIPDREAIKSAAVFKPSQTHATDSPNEEGGTSARRESPQKTAPTSSVEGDRPVQRTTYSHLREDSKAALPDDDVQKTTSTPSAPADTEALPPTNVQKTTATSLERDTPANPAESSTSKSTLAPLEGADLASPTTGQVQKTTSAPMASVEPVAPANTNIQKTTFEPVASAEPTIPVKTDVQKTTATPVTSVAPVTPANTNIQKTTFAPVASVEPVTPANTNAQKTTFEPIASSGSTIPVKSDVQKTTFAPLESTPTAATAQSQPAETTSTSVAGSQGSGVNTSLTPLTSMLIQEGPGAKNIMDNL